LIIIGGVSITQRSLTTRLGVTDTLKVDLATRYNKTTSSINGCKSKRDTILQVLYTLTRIEMARHERSYGLKIILGTQNSITNSPITGLVFTPVRTPYTPQRSFLPAKL
jgi:hypothetical protein